HDQQVPLMHGIEAAAEKADPHARRRGRDVGSAGNAQGRAEGHDLYLCLRLEATAGAAPPPARGRLGGGGMALDLECVSTPPHPSPSRGGCCIELAAVLRMPAPPAFKAATVRCRAPDT